MALCSWCCRVHCDHCQLPPGLITLWFSLLAVCLQPRFELLSHQLFVWAALWPCNASAAVALYHGSALSCVPCFQCCLCSQVSALYARFSLCGLCATCVGVRVWSVAWLFCLVFAYLYSCYDSLSTLLSGCLCLFLSISPCFIWLPCPLSQVHTLLYAYYCLIP